MTAFGQQYKKYKINIDIALNSFNSIHLATDLIRTRYLSFSGLVAFTSISYHQFRNQYSAQY